MAHFIACQEARIDKIHAVIGLKLLGFIRTGQYNLISMSEVIE